MRTAVDSFTQLRALFPGAVGYLNSATCGLPSTQTLAALADHVREWRDGEACLLRWDQPVQRSRELAAQLLGVLSSSVSVGSQVAVTAGTVAASLAPRTRVVMASGDFSSLTWPFVARADLDIVRVPLAELTENAREDVWVIASHVQSCDGAVLDLDALAHTGARTFIDATQSAGWLPVDATRFDVVTTGAYKWLLCPRGTAFTSWSPRALAEIAPQNPNWYAGRDVAASLYLDDVELAATARRHDVSPAWPCWAGAVPGLELLTSVGVARVGNHNVRLANELRMGLGLEPSDSAIVSLRAEPGVVDKLAKSGVRASYRGEWVRFAFHLYNDESDVAAVLRAL